MNSYRPVQFVWCQCLLHIHKKHIPPATSTPHHSSTSWLAHPSCQPLSLSWSTSQRQAFSMFLTPSCKINKIKHLWVFFIYYFPCKGIRRTPAYGCTRGIIPAPYPVRAALKVMPPRALCERTRWVTVGNASLLNLLISLRVRTHTNTSGWFQLHSKDVPGLNSCLCSEHEHLRDETQFRSPPFCPMLCWWQSLVTLIKYLECSIWKHVDKVTSSQKPIPIPFQHVNSDSGFIVVSTSLTMFFRAPLVHFWWLWLKLLLKKKSVESWQKSSTYICCAFLYTEFPIWVLSGCQVPSDGVVKSEYAKMMCLSTSRLVIESQGMFHQLYSFVKF